jgi:class 3 adenylate cyclase
LKYAYFRYYIVYFNQFNTLGREVGDVSNHKADTINGIIEGVANTFTSFGAYTQAEWPHVTIPHFHIRAQELLIAADVNFVAFSPIVERSDDAVSLWENYTVHNHEWLYEEIPGLPCGVFDAPSDDIHGHRRRRSTRSRRTRRRMAGLDGCEAEDDHDDEERDEEDEHGHLRRYAEEVLTDGEQTGANVDGHGEETHDGEEAHGDGESHDEDEHHDEEPPPEHIWPLGSHHPESHVPLWQTSPTQDSHAVNYDLLAVSSSFQDIFHHVIKKGEPIFSQTVDLKAIFGSSAPDSGGHPQSLLVEPIFDEFEGSDHGIHDDHVVGLLIVALPWDRYFSDIIHEGASGLHITVKNTCGDEFSYEIHGHQAHYLGEGDHHDPKYDDLFVVSDFEPFPQHNEDDEEHLSTCHYSFHIYPTQELEYQSNRPAIMTAAVLLIFIFTILAFLTYDKMVQRRQQVVMDSAMKSNAIVSSLFPAEFRDRLFHGGAKSKKKMKKNEMTKRIGGLLPSLSEAPKSRLNSFLQGDAKTLGSSPDTMANGELQSKPIADLFPNTTVMFADIVGFTAWSSVRDPYQVFTLLETIYRAFDNIAKRRRVFKVETIGDCYVAVAGLPEARKDHALAMARFANECLMKLQGLTASLEVTLGPDTGDLTMRVGLHSGPVTAGVLRGEKSRFQLFGDTVNTAARMESTGEPRRIQISSETAALLSTAGKESWCEKRATTVMAKGKGELTTYWLMLKQKAATAGSEFGSERIPFEEQPNLPSTSMSPLEGRLSAKTERMVGWNVDIFIKLLQQIGATRDADMVIPEHEKLGLKQMESFIGCSDGTVQDEVTEFVTLPDFCKAAADKVKDPSTVVLPTEVVDQLRLFVKQIALMYNENPFHSFEHASHVTMSVSKLLSRIVAADVTPEQREQGQGVILSDMHDRTYGITSDPVVQFAVVFSALIHDVDHRGLPNFLLVEEDRELAMMYDNRSVAEQNSVDLAWDKLMQPAFAALRRYIYTSTSELERFRQTVVNNVMATDIFDKGFAQLRKRRWDRCFHQDIEEAYVDADDVHRRAEIVLEHVIQASDVAHTMQHWQIYQKWNKRLFEEMHLAYRTGRSKKDPSENWYESELGFFDNYIIPLAKKLKECGVFGVSSDEYLKYALDNRHEWSVRGKDIVAQAMASMSVVPRDKNTDGESDVVQKES